MKSNIIKSYGNFYNGDNNFIIKLRRIESRLYGIRLLIVIIE